MNAPEARFQDDIVIVSAAPRQANTRFGPKTVWDIGSQDGRKFQSWDQQLGMQAANLLNQQVRVIYKEKPSRDPSYPPNLELETIQPLGLAGPGAAAAPAATPAPAQVAPQPAQQAPQAAPAPAAAAPLPAAQGTAGAGTGGPSPEDKASMRRSAAVKAAAYLAAGADQPEIDFWRLAAQILVFIETGNDPIPFLGGDAETSPEQQPIHHDEFPPGF